MRDVLHLQDGEMIILSFRKHWAILAFRVLNILAVALVPFFVYGYFSSSNLVPPGMRAAHIFQFVGAWWLLICWLSVAAVWTKYYLELWIVTNRRIVSSEQRGLFNRDVTTWGIERILETTVHVENIVQTFLDYGTLEIHTAGQDDAHERVTGVPHPTHVREVIMAEASRVRSLEETNRNQENLLHTISHEFKSYLTKDAASLASIAEGDVGTDPEKVRSFAKVALGETRKGVSAVLDILHSSDPRRGTIKIESTVFDVRPLVQELHDVFSPVAERKHLAFTISAKDGVFPVRGDQIKLRDLVLRNLVDNALRYTSAGSVLIELTQNSDEVVLTISDTGVGISADDMQKLFSPGGAGTNSRSVNPESTGFGLLSVRQILDAIGGKISVQSEGPGKGSRFTVTLPRAS